MSKLFRGRGFWLAGLAGLLVVLVGISACVRYSKTSRARFPHSQHRLVPCKNCHKPDKQGDMHTQAASTTCGVCHQEAQPYRPNWNVLVRASAPSQEIIFSHSAHEKRVKPGKEGCKVCHGEMSSAAGGSRMPTMAKCLSCHNHQKEYDKMLCKKCHTDLRRFALKPVSDYRHTPDFARSHKHHAKGRIDLCVTCHDQPFCVRCHDPKLPVKPTLRFPEQVTAGFIHRGDYLPRHGREARLNPTLCGRCHGESTCVGCHQNRTKYINAPSGRSPHPPGYARRGGIAFHGRDARRDPSRCQSCHDQGAQSNCVTCHRVGGIGGNPHPPGWKAWNPQGRLDPRKNAMCLHCHRWAKP